MSISVDVSQVVCNPFTIGASVPSTIIKGSYIEDGRKKTITHDVGFRLTSGGTIQTIAQNITEGTVLWNTSQVRDLLYSSIPTSTGGVAYIVLTMKANGIAVEQTQEMVTFNISRENSKPTITNVSIVDTNSNTVALTGNASKMIMWMSKPKVTATMTARNQASLKEMNIYHAGELKAGPSATFNNLYGTEFILQATDSRGLSERVVQNITAVEYYPAHFLEVSIQRTESTSTVVRVSAKGYCYKGNFGKLDNTLTVTYACTSKTDGSKTSGTLTGVTWNADGTFSVSQNLSGFALKGSYEIVLTVSDKLTQFVSDDIYLGESVGDLRIGKDYILSKNAFVVGAKGETSLKPVRARRVVNGVQYESEYGVGNINDDGIPSLLLQLFKDVGGVKTLLGRMDMRQDGFLYNALTNMSVAEIMSYAPSVTGGGLHGWCLLNGGEGTQPVLLQWGRVSVTPSAANTVTKTPINFTYPFIGAPFVVSDIASGAPGDVFLNVGDISSTGFSFYFKRTNTQTISTLWLAIGNGTAGLPI